MQRLEKQHIFKQHRAQRKEEKGSCFGPNGFIEHKCGEDHDIAIEQEAHEA
jgi:hypothetical protein